VQLAAGQCRVLATPPGRLCGTPGCCFRDGHDGAHSFELRLPPRRPPLTARLQEPRRRSPRLAPPTFQWVALDTDLQAAILSRLDDNPARLLLRLASLARNIRPMHPEILRMLRSDGRLNVLLGHMWMGETYKFSTEGSELRCQWRNMHANVARQALLDEHLAVVIKLCCDDRSPHRWKWRLRILWDVLTPSEALLNLCDYELTMSATSRLGVPVSAGRRLQRIGSGHIVVAPRKRLAVHGVCSCRCSFGGFARLLVSVPRGVLCFCERGIDPVIEWQLPPDALGLMQLVASLV
jgi:hypothetical protein